MYKLYSVHANDLLMCPRFYCSSLLHALRSWSGDGMFPDSLPTSPTSCVWTSREEGLVVPSS